MKSMIVIKNKLICYSAKYYLFSKGPKLFVTDSLEKKSRVLGVLPSGAIKAFIGGCRLGARLFRLEPRCGIFVDDTIALVSYHGAIYRVNCDTGEVLLEHHFRTEMNNPLSFVKLKNVNGFDDGIYYGEYYLNHESKDVNIFRRKEDGLWKKVYTFKPKEIYHIHNIVPCQEKGCVYVLTGDKDKESTIYEFRRNFNEVDVIVSGKQAYRSCVALPTDRGLIYTTDTPLEDNYLYHLDTRNKELEKIMQLPGPSIYSKVLSKSELIFSTTVESDSTLPRWRYEFSWKLGKGVKDRYTHLFYVSVNDGKVEVRELLKAKKDFFPSGCGQMGTLMFPTGENGFFITGQSIKKYDNKTMRL